LFVFGGGGSRDGVAVEIGRSAEDGEELFKGMRFNGVAFNLLRRCAETGVVHVFIAGYSG
jgi:hypothetical protein